MSTLYVSPSPAPAHVVPAALAAGETEEQADSASQTSGHPPAEKSFSNPFAHSHKQPQGGIWGSTSSEQEPSIYSTHAKLRSRENPTAAEVTNRRLLTSNSVDSLALTHRGTLRSQGSVHRRRDSRDSSNSEAMGWVNSPEGRRLSQHRGSESSNFSFNIPGGLGGQSSRGTSRGGSRNHTSRGLISGKDWSLFPSPDKSHRSPGR